MRKVKLLVLAILGASLLLASWLGTALGQAGPSVRITSPAEGSTVSGPKVRVTWTSSGATITPAAQALTKEEAHFHLFVDTDATRYLTSDLEIPRDVPNIVHTASLETGVDLAPGKHSLTLVLSYNNHVAWKPAVTSAVTFTVGAAPGVAPASGVGPQASSSGGPNFMWLPAVIAGGILGTLGLSLLLRRRPYQR